MRADFSLLTEPGNERLTMERVAKLVREAPISATKVERLKTAVAEITMNAMEHANQYRYYLEVKIQLLVFDFMTIYTDESSA